MRTPEDKSGNLDLTKQVQWTYFPDGLVKSRSDQKGQPITIRQRATVGDSGEASSSDERG